MGEKFVDLADMGLVARLLKQFEEFFESRWAATHRSDDRAQGFKDLGGIFCQ